MPTALIIGCIAWGAGMASLVWMILTAPEGHELPGIGFRYGPEPFDEPRRDTADALNPAGSEITPFHAGDIARG